VIVLGQGDLPLAGVLVRAALPDGAWNPDPDRKAAVTGADGVARLHGEFRGRPEVLLSGAVPDTRVPLATRSTVVRIPALLPLDVAVVDGWTGREIPGASAALRRPGGDLQAVRTPGEGGRRETPLVRAGAFESLNLAVDLPAGYAPPAPGATLNVASAISRYAERARAEVVAWPEARIRLRVEDADGNPVAGARPGFLACGRWSREAAEGISDAAGALPIRGLPCIPGEGARAAVRLGDRIGAASFALPAPGEERTATVVLPREPNAGTSIGVGGGAGGAFEGRQARSRNTRHAAGAGEVEVEVRRRDGRPAAEAKVVVLAPDWPRQEGRTGADGRIAFRPIPAGEATVSLEEPGLPATPVRATVEAGSRAQVLLVEEEGASSEVLVLLADGAPAPGAELRVTCSSGLPYVRMDGAVQVLTHRTGPDGRCALPGLPPGSVTVQAALGGRTASATGEAGAPLEIALPPWR
jgi:hypothetical protein